MRRFPGTFEVDVPTDNSVSSELLRAGAGKSESPRPVGYRRISRRLSTLRVSHHSLRRISGLAISTPADESNCASSR